jgi:hypothetical protein
MEREINRAANASYWLDETDLIEQAGTVIAKAGLLLAKYRETDCETYGEDE